MLDFMSLLPQLFHHLVKAILVDRADAFGGELQRDPFVFFSQEIALCLQVGQEPAFSLDIRVRNRVSRDGHFTCDLAYSGHV